MFAATLSNIVRGVEGARGAAVLNLAGVVVEAVDASGNPVGADDVLADYADVFQQIANVDEAVDMGHVGRMTVQTPDGAMYLRALSEHYVVALNTTPETIPGKAHFKLRVAAPDLAREL